MEDRAAGDMADQLEPLPKEPATKDAGTMESELNEHAPAKLPYADRVQMAAEEPSAKTSGSASAGPWQAASAALSAPASAAAGANAALAIFQHYEEFKARGCPVAAAAVLRQGLRFCPDSAVLKSLAEKEGISAVPEEVELTGAALMEQLRRREMILQQCGAEQAVTTTGGSEEVEPWQAAAPAQEEQAASAGAGADAAPDPGLAILQQYKEFKEMGCPEAAAAVLREGLAFCPDSAVLKSLAEKEGTSVVPEAAAPAQEEQAASAGAGADAAPDPGLAILQQYKEFKEMGCVEAAAAVLREGLAFCPDSAVLKSLAEKEGTSVVPEAAAPAQEEQAASAGAGADAAPDPGLAIFQQYKEFKEIGCVEAAAAVLRQGLASCPDSAVLKSLAEKEGISAAPQEDEHQLWRREMQAAQHRQRMHQMQQRQALLDQPEYAHPPILPEPRKGKIVVPPPATRFLNEEEYPDKKKATRAMAAAAAGSLFGLILSILEPCSAYYLVWSFLACHLALLKLLRDDAGERASLFVAAFLAFHGGHALAELRSWLLAADGADSLGPWSIVVIFACILYMQSYVRECITLPPDYICTLSFFFPVFPAYDAAVVLSCLEFFLEWKYFPDSKIWTPIVVLGLVSMALGQGLVIWAARVADRNFWASTREVEEDKLVGLEIPNRRVVREGPYAWERHPAYMGAILWGVGTQLALCNPAMLVIVALVLWAALLHVTMEEEKELFDEFPGLYVNYSALTSCWIPGFPRLLENVAFQRELDDNAPEEEGDDLLEQEESEVEEIDEEDDLLPTWEGVPKGGAIWNRQFQDPWRLG